MKWQNKRSEYGMKIGLRKVVKIVPADEEQDELLRQAEEIDAKREEMKREYQVIIRNALIKAIKTRDLHLLLEICFIIMKEKFDELCDC